MKFYLSMFCFIILKTNVESVILDIKPSTNIQPGSPSLTIKCQPSTGEVTKIFQLDIKRNDSGTDDIMGTVTVGNTPELGTGFGGPKYTVSGSIQDINSVSTAFLEIVIQDPDCNDKGEYVCGVSGSTGSGAVTLEKRTSVTVQDVESVILDISPSTNIKAGDPSLTIRCQPTTGDVTSIYQLNIKRNTSGTDDVMGTVTVGKSPELGTGFGSPKYTVSGSIQDIDSVSTAFLQIVIQDPDCNDKGEYVCIVTGAASDGSTLTLEKRIPVTVQENPSAIELYVVPEYSEYDTDITILMSCDGNVGNPKQTWQWQTRRFPASTQWVRLTDGVIDRDVTPPTGASCSYRQQTNLTYTVTSQDDGLQIRCILDNTEDLSKNFTINLKALSDTSSMSTSSTTSSVNPSENVTKLNDNPTGCAQQFRVTDTTAVTVLGVLVALYCCFFI